MADPFDIVRGVHIYREYGGCLNFIQDCATCAALARLEARIAELETPAWDRLAAQETRRQGARAQAAEAHVVELEAEVSRLRRYEEAYINSTALAAEARCEATGVMLDEALAKWQTWKDKCEALTAALREIEQKAALVAALAEA